MTEHECDRCHRIVESDLLPTDWMRWKVRDEHQVICDYCRSDNGNEMSIFVEAFKQSSPFGDAS